MKLMVAHFNNVLFDVQDRLVKRGHEIIYGSKEGPYENKDVLREADVMVIWNESPHSGKAWVDVAHSVGTPAVLVQHGRKGSSKYYPPFNEELASDKMCVWGENDRRRLVEDAGFPEDRIVVTGSPIMPCIKPTIEHEGKNLLYCPEHWGADEVDENLVVATKLRELDDVYVKTKILATEHRAEWYENPIVSHRNMKGHLEKCVDSLRDVDVVVSLIEGTFELIAQAMDIPVVLADIWVPKTLRGDERFLSPEYIKNGRIYSNAVARITDIDDLIPTIRKELENPERLKEERKEIVRLEGGSDIEDPVGEIVKVIESYEGVHK